MPGVTKGPGLDWLPNQELRELANHGHAVLTDENAYFSKEEVEVCICAVLCHGCALHCMFGRIKALLK